jgi:hypothetical protein
MSVLLYQTIRHHIAQVSASPLSNVHFGPKTSLPLDSTTTNCEATQNVTLCSLSQHNSLVLFRNHTTQPISVGLNKRLLLAQHVPHREHISLPKDQSLRKPADCAGLHHGLFLFPDFKQMPKTDISKSLPLCKSLPDMGIDMMKLRVIRFLHLIFKHTLKNSGTSTSP